MESLEQQFSEDLSLTKPSNSMDTMIVQTVGLLDERDKHLYTYGKKVRELYGRHFPELSKIVPHTILYAKSVKLMGNRSNAAKLDFSKILADEVEAELKEASTIFKGREISDVKLMQVRELCDEVITIAEQRALLYVNLISMMNHGAPNLTALVGELVGARLISRGGGLTNLVKEGRLIQSLLTPLLRKKHEIPKSGLIYQVSQAAGKVKGKMTRSLAAKAALAIRCDAFGDCRNNTVGLKNRAKLEAWFKIILEAKPKIKVAKVETYATDTDSLLVQTPTKSESEAMEE